MLRNLHSGDAPFSVDDFTHGVEFYRGVDGKLVRYDSRAHASVSEFTDARPNRYQNPKLPFGGADIPEEGFSYKLVAPGDRAPAGSRVRIDYNWRAVTK